MTEPQRTLLSLAPVYEALMLRHYSERFAVRHRQTVRLEAGSAMPQAPTATAVRLRERWHALRLKPARDVEPTSGRQ